MKRSAFTLTELLVVIAILFVLAAILFPVFAQTRARAHQTACLSNGRQISTACFLYAADYDENLPPGRQMFVFIASDGDPKEGTATTIYPPNSKSWTELAQPYIKTRQMYRCPTDASQNWATPQSQQASILDPVPPVLRGSSYMLNAWMTGRYGYGNLSATRNPASVIYLSESLEGITRDHYYPFHWIAETPHNPFYSAFMHAATFDDSKNETRELALTQHQGGFNNVYLDGHSKWSKWSQVWWQKPEHRVWDGAFDPRQ